MINKKEMEVYNAIKNFIESNNYSPTIRELCNILSYKSTRTIYNYLNKLKSLKLINYENKKTRSITINNMKLNNIFIINTQKILELNLDNTIIYQIKNNYFKKNNILKNDYLIINIKKKLINNDLGLFIIDNNYRLMKYTYKNGFYILEDNEKEVLNKVKIIGKVMGIYHQVNK